MLEYIDKVLDLLVARGYYRGLSSLESALVEEAFKRGNNENDCASFILEMRNQGW